MTQPTEPPTGPERTPPRAEVRHPVAPRPPRSRVPAYVLSGLAGLILGPLATAMLALGARTAAPDQIPAATTVSSLALAAVGFAVVAGAGAGSGLGPVLAGLFASAVGLFHLAYPASAARATERAVEPFTPATGSGLAPGVVELGQSGQLLVLGLMTLLVGAAAHFARRAGVVAEKSEAALAAAHEPASVPTAPGTRVIAHAVVVVLGLALTPVALALIAAGVGRLAAAGAEAHSIPSLFTNPAALGTLVLAAVVLAGRYSSFGLLAGGVLWGLIPGWFGMLNPPAESRLADAVGRLGSYIADEAEAGLGELSANGTLLAWGAIAVAGALGIHAARRDGVRRERAEIALRWEQAAQFRRRAES